MSSAIQTTVSTGKPFSVLIVDDEPDVRSQLRIRFQLEGFQVLDADGGDAAFKVVEKHKPDLVITDIRMPGGTGTDLLKRLSTNLRDEMPVVLCITGYSDLQVHEAYQHGAYAVFQKPFDMKDVVFASRRFLDLRAKQQQTNAALANFDKDLRQVLGIVKRDKLPSDTDTLSMADLRQVISMIVHEVNSPLSVISMNSNLLTNTLLQGPGRLEAAQRMAKVIEQNCQRLVEISHTLRDLFSQRMRGKPEKFSMQSVVADAIAMMDEHAALAGLDVRVVATPDLAVLGVKQQLVQLVRNLLENAAYANRQMSQKRIDVEVARKDDKVLLVVSDRGPGVPEEIKEEIFEPYFTTKGKEGTGMGLSICRKVAQAHQGTLTLEPSREGAKFVLTLKIVE